MHFTDREGVCGRGMVMEQGLEEGEGCSTVLGWERLGSMWEGHMGAAHP